MQQRIIGHFGIDNVWSCEVAGFPGFGLVLGVAAVGSFIHLFVANTD